MKYAQDNGFAHDCGHLEPVAAKPGALVGRGVDITKAVVDAYNAQSGVPAPLPAGAAAGEAGSEAQRLRSLRLPSRQPHPSSFLATPRVSKKFPKAAFQRGLFSLPGPPTGDGFGVL